MSKLLYLIAWMFLLSSCLWAEEAVISFKGYLNEEQITAAKEQIAGATTVIVEVNSSSGDFKQVLDFAKTLYRLKSQGTKVVVYIDDTAVGPAAMIPFLADELYISFFVSWGDIPLGAETMTPTNILRNRVVSLVPSDSPNAELLRLMAAAMADPALLIVDDNGWKVESSEDFHRVIASKDEALVVNHNQLRALGLVKEILSPEQFRAKYTVATTVKKEEKVLEKAVPQLDKRLAEYIKYDETGPNRVGMITIDDRKTGITQSTWIYVKKALDYYKERKAKFVILELNTPGGEVFAAQKISDALKELDTQYNIPVVAFINNWAISAGAMLAYSCRFITTVKDGSMGAAEPVLAGEGGQMQAASEKVNSALRTDFANRAGFFDRNPNIAEAMVDKDIILVQRYEKIIRLDNEEQIRTKGPDPDTLITAKGKLLTLNADQMLEYDVADILLLPKKTELITEKERAEGKWSASKMLLFQNPFFSKIPNAVVDVYQMDWKTYFFVLLANPLVSSMLFLGMMLGFYVEINTPGFGVPGGVALACLGLIALSSFALEVGNWLEMILLLVGVSLIAMDLFVTPTFGLLGFAGVVLALMGLFGLMLPGIEAVDFEFDTQTFNAAGEAFMERLAWLSGTIVVGVILIAILARYVMPSFAAFNRFVLAGNEETADAGYIAGSDPSKLPQPGTKGKVAATLRPAGKVLIEDNFYDAVTGGEFIEKDQSIVVSRLDGSVIVVKGENEI